LPTSTNLVINVTDMLGQTLNSMNLNNSKGGVFHIDLSNQSAGVYFVNIQTSESSITKKITLTK